jgi:hypothetical protein
MPRAASSWTARRAAGHQQAQLQRHHHPAFLPAEESERQGIYQELSDLIQVPVTNTVKPEALLAQANPELVSTYTRLAEIYGASVAETLDQAGVVEQQPDSIEGIVAENSFAPYVPAVITTGVPITVAYQIEQREHLPARRARHPPSRCANTRRARIRPT